MRYFFVACTEFYLKITMYFSYSAFLFFFEKNSRKEQEAAAARAQEEAQAKMRADKAARGSN